MSEVSVPTTEQNVRRTEDTSVYRTYNFRYRPKTTLPIHHIRNNIVTMIASNPVVVIRGSTGCGKTTQVPQFILDAEFENNRYCNIIGTLYYSLKTPTDQREYLSLRIFALLCGSLYSEFS